MVVIVADACLISSHKTLRLDTADEPDVGECGENVIHRLAGDLGQIRASGLEEGLRVGMGVCVNSLQHRHPGTGDAEFGGTQHGCEVRR